MGFSILPWKILNQTKDKIVYQLHSANDDQGFPGDLVINCTYQLINKYLIIKYEYKSNKSTHVNLTNHSYWNLEKNKKLNIKFKGFDTTFFVKKNNRNLVGTLKNNNTNIQVDFFSNLPGLQLYSAQNLNYKKKLFPYQGICLETQYFPDAPNKKNFPSTLIKPNKRYTCFTKIKIS